VTGTRFEIIIGGWGNQKNYRSEFLQAVSARPSGGNGLEAR
jgi:hypothetical protein